MSRGPKGSWSRQDPDALFFFFVISWFSVLWSTRSETDQMRFNLHISVVGVITVEPSE